MSLFAVSGTKRSASARRQPDPTGLIAAHETVADRRAEIEAVRHADVLPLPDAVGRPTDRLVEVPAEIATARERAERTFPPDRWMGGSHCRSHV